MHIYKEYILYIHVYVQENFVWASLCVPICVSNSFDIIILLLKLCCKVSIAAWLLRKGFFHLGAAKAFSTKLNSLNLSLLIT